MSDRCRHCEQPIGQAPTGRPRRYCGQPCRLRARRRRHAGIAENAYAGATGARRGSVPLGTPTAAEAARARVAEILAARPST